MEQKMLLGISFWPLAGLNVEIWAWFQSCKSSALAQIQKAKS
jgi:hypothetical protein